MLLVCEQIDKYNAPNICYMWFFRLCYYKGCAIKEADAVCQCLDKYKKLI